MNEQQNCLFNLKNDVDSIDTFEEKVTNKNYGSIQNKLILNISQFHGNVLTITLTLFLKPLAQILC